MSTLGRVLCAPISIQGMRGYIKPLSDIANAQESNKMRRVPLLAIIWFLILNVQCVGIGKDRLVVTFFNRLDAVSDNKLCDDISVEV